MPFLAPGWVGAAKMRASELGEIVNNLMVARRACEGHISN
jgi:hypothetical protein